MESGLSRSIVEFNTSPGCTLGYHCGRFTKKATFFQRIEKKDWSLVMKESEERIKITYMYRMIIEHVHPSFINIRFRNWQSRKNSHTTRSNSVNFSSQAIKLDGHYRQNGNIGRINYFYWEILFFSRVIIILPSEVG